MKKKCLHWLALCLIYIFGGAVAEGAVTWMMVFGKQSPGAIAIERLNNIPPESGFRGDRYADIFMVSDINEATIARLMPAIQNNGSIEAS